MFRNRSDLITAIIIYGILGRCERVCKKFEWTEKKNETNRPTDSRGCPTMLSSPSSARQTGRQTPFHGLRNNALETQNALWRNNAPARLYIIIIIVRVWWAHEYCRVVFFPLYPRRTVPTRRHHVESSLS